MVFSTVVHYDTTQYDTTRHSNDTTQCRHDTTRDTTRHDTVQYTVPVQNSTAHIERQYSTAR
jgi:hypothetical protein